MNGGDGIDLACARGDFTTVVPGVPSVLDLTLNDQFLADEDDETTPLTYEITEAVPAGIIASLDPLTGVLTFTASVSGWLQYSVSRAGNPFASFVNVFITVLSSVPDEEGPDDRDDDDDDDADDESDDDSKNRSRASDKTDEAVLPDTGATSDLEAAGGLGLALVTTGLLLMIAARRPRAHDSR
jgi:hypothetical protein